MGLSSQSQNETNNEKFRGRSLDKIACIILKNKQEAIVCSLCVWGDKRCSAPLVSILREVGTIRKL